MRRAGLRVGVGGDILFCELITFYTQLLIAVRYIRRLSFNDIDDLE